MIRLAIVIALAVLIAPVTRGGNGQDLPEWANRPIKLHMVEPCTGQDLLEYFARVLDADSATDTDASTWANPRPEEIKTVWVVRDVPRKYLVSWLAHFLNGTAVLRGRRLLITRAPSPSDTPVDCFAETNGVWKTRMTTALQRTLTPSEGAIDWVQYVEYLTSKAEVSFVTDPDIAPSLAKRTPVKIESTEQTIDSALTSALAQIGATFTCQGGVVFITRKERTAQQPSSASHLTLINVKSIPFSLRFDSPDDWPLGTNKRGFIAEKFTPKYTSRVDADGSKTEVDVSELTIKRGDRTITLVKGVGVRYEEYEVELGNILTQDRYTLRLGEAIDIQGRQLRLISVNLDQRSCTLEDVDSLSAFPLH